MNFLRRALVKHPETGLSILRHPLEIQDIGLIHEAHVERILNLLKISYTHLVLDLSKALLPTDLMALRMADMILLVAQLELSQPAERGAADALPEPDEDDLADKIRVVINRVGAETVEEGISLKKAEEVIGKPIFWQMPNDSKAMIAARVAGQPLVQHNPKCRAQQSIVGLAQALVRQADGTGRAAATKRASGWSLFGKR